MGGSNVQVIGPARRAAAALALALAASALAGQGPEVAVSDTALYLESDREAEKLLGAARKAARAGQWREAIDAYQRVIDFAPPADTQPLVPSRRGSAVYLPIQAAAARELARTLDERGLGLYREAHDEPARQLLARALPSRDVALLGDVARRYLATSSGDDALAALGSIAFERGDFVGALAAWRRLLASCRRPSVSPAAIRARIWASLHALGRGGEADALRRELLARHGAERLRIGGRQIALAEFLAHPPALRSRGPLGEWPMLGGGPSHAAVPRGIGDVGSRLWAFHVPNALPDAAARRRFERRDIRVPLPMHATVADGRLFLANEAAVYALDAATGRVLWMYPDAPEEPRAPALAEAVHAVACAEGRAFATLADRTAAAHVAAFDAATGKLLWRHPLVEEQPAPPQEPAEEPEDDPDDEAKKDAPPPSKPALLATPPVAVGGRVFVGLAVLGDEARVSLLALDAASGQRLWRTFVCSRTISAFLGLGATPSAPAVDGATAYFSTNLGALAAIDAATGRIRWVHRYPAFHTYLRKTLVERRRRWANEPPVVARGRVFAAPQDGALLLALRADTGEMLWTTPRQGGRHVIAGGAGRLYVAGRTLAAVDARTGKRLWAVELPGPPQGRPLADRRGVHISTSDKLLAAAAADGALTTSRLWQEGELPGNIVVAGGRMFVVSSDRVVAYDDWAKVRLRLEAQRKAAPDAPAPLLAVGRHEAQRGGFAAAIGHFEQALRLAEAKKAPGAIQQARRGLYQAYRGLAGRRGPGEWKALATALAHAPGSDTAADTLLAMARFHERRGQWERAVNAYQSILLDHPRAQCRVDGTLAVSGRALATAEIGRIVRLRSASVYSKHEVRATQLLEKAKRAAGLEAVVRNYPNSAAAERAMLRLLERPVAKVLAPDLAALARLLATDAASPRQREQIAAKLAALQRPAGGRRPPLAPRWEVHTRIGHRRIELMKLDGAPPGLMFFAFSRLSYGRAFHGIECRQRDTGALVWQRDMDSWDRRAIVAGRLLVLAPLGRLLAIDLRSGVLRWEASVAEEPLDAPLEGELPPAAPVPPLRWRTEHARVAALAGSGDAVYVGLAGGKLVALSGKDGQRLWTRQLDARQLLADGLFVHGGSVWACVAFPAAVHVLDAQSGKTQRRLKLGGLDPRITDRPAFDTAGGRLYLVLGDRAVHCLDLRTRRERWARRLGFGIREILLSRDGTRAYVVPSSSTAGAEIVLLDPKTGDVLRRRSVRTGALADAALAPEALYVAERDADGFLVVQALDPRHLGVRWRTVPLRLTRASPLAVGGGMVAVAGRQAQEPVAVLIDAASGRIVADKTPPGALRLSVGLVGDLVCIGSDRGIHAFGPSEAERLDQRIAALRSRAQKGDRHSLLSLANALYRRGQEARGIALLAQALGDESLPDGDYFALKDQLNSLRESLARRRPAVITTPRLAVGPKIDGTIDEPWRLDCAAILDGPAHIQEVQGRPHAATRWRSPSDLSAVLYTAWDERRFYFAIDVTDDIHRTYTGQRDTWVGDGLIISIDSQNDGGYGYSFSSNDVLLTLALTRKDERRDDRDDDSTPDGEYRVRRKDDNSGTVYEVAIPWSYLGLRPRPGLRFGFNITVTDDDGDRATKAVSWTPGMVLDRRRALMIRGFTPEHFGDVLLTGPPRGQAPAPPKPDEVQEKP